MAKWTRVARNVEIENDEVQLSGDNALSSLGKFAFKEAAPPEGRFFVAGSRTFRTSTDGGETWAYTPDEFADSTICILGIDYGEINGTSKYVIVGGYGSSMTPYSAYSTDAITWNSMSGAKKTYFHDVAFGKIGDQEILMGVGYWGNWKSTDGVKWTAMSGVGQAYTVKSVAYGVINNQDIFVATYNNNAYYTTDGESWVAGGTLEYGGEKTIFVEDKFVTAGTNGISYSTDGINWTTALVNTTSRNFLGLAYGNGKYVAIATSQAYANLWTYTSTDGISWSAIEIPKISDITITGNTAGICYGAGKFIWCSANNLYYLKDNATSWEKQTSLASYIINCAYHGDV